MTDALLPSEVPFPVDVHRVRVMYADGEVVDYLTSVQDSRFLGFAVEHHYGKKPDTHARIVGTADLGVVYTHIPRQPPAADPFPIAMGTPVKPVKAVRKRMGVTPSTK